MSDRCKNCGLTEDQHTIQPTDGPSLIRCPPGNPWPIRYYEPGPNSQEEPTFDDMLNAIANRQYKTALRLVKEMAQAGGSGPIRHQPGPTFVRNLEERAERDGDAVQEGADPICVGPGIGEHKRLRAGAVQEGAAQHQRERVAQIVRATISKAHNENQGFPQLVDWAVDSILAVAHPTPVPEGPECCSICTGRRKTLTGEPCICKTGTIYGELEGLRRELLKLTAGPAVRDASNTVDKKP